MPPEIPGAPEPPGKGNQAAGAELQRASIAIRRYELQVRKASLDQVHILSNATGQESGSCSRQGGRIGGSRAAPRNSGTL